MDKAWTWLKDQQGGGTVNFGGGLPMIWSCATPQGVGHICRMDGRIDGELHINILQDKFPATVVFCGSGRQNYNLHQNNDPKHPPRKASKWSQQTKVNI